MNAREARKDFEAGQLPAEQLLDLLQRQERLLQRLSSEIQRLKQRLAQYEPEILQEPAAPEPDQQPPSASYSLDAEEKRRQPRKRRKKSPGRRPTELKLTQAQIFENVYPDGVPRDDYP